MAKQLISIEVENPVWISRLFRIGVQRHLAFDFWPDEIRMHNNIEFKGGGEAAPDDGGQGPQDQPHLQGYSTQVLQYR